MSRAKNFLRPIAKALNATGFEGVAVDSEGGKDDEFIKREINNLPDGSVDEIVLVAADLDYFDTLKKKQEAGVKVFVVATAENDPCSNRPPIQPT